MKTNITTYMREKLPGYRSRLNVYEVSSCPQNKSLWLESAANMGCNLDIGSPYSSTNFYYCIPTQSKSKLVEFCYDGISQGIQKGLCLELTEKGFLKTVDCHYFVDGCPDEHYLPETLFNYPACFQVNTDQRCYLAENGCLPLSSVYTEKPTSLDFTSKYDSSPFTTLSFSNVTSAQTPSTDSPTTTVILSAVIPCAIFVLILILVIARLIWRKRKSQKKQDEEDSLRDGQELREQDEEDSLWDGQELREQDEEDSLLNGKELPNIHIYGETSVVYGQQIIINVTTDAFPHGFQRVQWMKIDSMSEKKINTDEEKYSGSSDNLSGPLLVINNANFSDAGIYKIKAVGVLSNELNLVVTGSVPSVSISRFKMEGKKTIIVCESSVTQDSPKITSVQWTRNAYLIDTSQHPDKYSGGTIQDPSLTIKYLDTSDIGEYRCIVRNNVGETESESFHLNIDIRIKGRTRVVSGHKAIIYGTVTCIQQHSFNPTFGQDMQNVKWIKTDGTSESNINIQDDKYSGSSNEPRDLSLVINKADFQDKGIYMLKINGLLSNEIQLNVTEHDVTTMPTEVQLVLCFLLLQENFQINFKEEDLSLPFEFLDCKTQTKEELGNVLRKFKEALIPYIDESDGRYEINPDIRDDIVLSFMKKEEFGDIFFDKACIDNIKKYCRTTTYKAKDGEVCFILNSQQTESFIERLQYDILTHATIDDIESHSLIASKLKIPIEILRRGKEGIQEYLQQLSKGKVRVYHARGMIVGCAGAGKTTLLKKLKDCQLSDILNTASTRGVDIQSDVFSVAKDELSVNSEEITSHFNIKQSEIAPERDAIESNRGKYTQQLREDVNGDEKKKLLPSLPGSYSEPEIGEKNRTIEKQSRNDFPKNRMEDAISDHAQEIEKNIYIITKEFDIQPKPQKLKKIQALSFLSDLKEKIPKTITFFDFAGQLAYYVTHQIFLSPRAFYILVIDMKKNLDDPMEKDEAMTKKTYREIIRHWMEMIHAFNGMAPVILVATHAEGESTESIKSFFRQIWKLIPEDIQKRHLDDQREFAVELKKTFGIKEIKSSILHIVSKADHWGEVRPTSWVMFESYLVKTKEKIKVMKTKDLWTENKHLDRKFQLEKEEDMKNMLQFFHDTGAILYFDEDGLRNDIILDVPWFVDAFKHIITDPVHANEDFVRIQDTFVSTHCECQTALTDLEKSGILRVSLVRAIWKLYKDRYDTYIQHMREIMRYMERMGMLAILTTSPEEMWYVPCMNKRLFSEQEFADFTVSQTLCFQFKFLPPSIYHRLISTCLNQLGFTIPNWPKPEYFYKNAVLLHKKSFEQRYYVLIGNNELQNRIDIQFLSRKDFKVDRKNSTALKNEITIKLKGLKETFHTNLGSFTIGYQCRINIFSEELAAHFIPESDFQGTAISCPDCKPLNRIVVQDVLYQWNQEGETVPKTDEDQIRSSWPCVIIFAWSWMVKFQVCSRKDSLAYFTATSLHKNTSIHI